MQAQIRSFSLLFQYGRKLAFLYVKSFLYIKEYVKHTEHYSALSVLMEIEFLNGSL